MSRENPGLRWWLHSLRPKHERRMAYAEAKVESSLAYRRIADRDRDSELLVHSVKELRRAIATVVECGCPRELWREQVQEYIKAMKGGACESSRTH